MSKKKIEYINGNIPENIAEILSKADEQDLKILVLLLMGANENGEVDEALSVEEKLGLSKSEVDASLKFWKGAGVVGTVRASRKKTAEKTAESSHEEPKTVQIPEAHRNGAVESGDADNYGSLELATLIQKRVVSACFVDEAQKVFGKSFNQYDSGIVVGLVDRYDFEEEAVLAILAYVRKLGKKGVKYAEKFAISLYDDGITTTHEVVDRIDAIEKAKEELFKIKKMYGFGSRDLTKTEKELFEKWLNTYGYSEEIIRIAFDMTVNSIQRPVPKYTDKILEKWYGQGLRTKEDIEAFEKNKKDSKGDNDPQKSYEIDDFFAAALNRSLKDLK